MRLGLGCVNLGSSAHSSDRDDVRLVRGAIDAGVTVFDTADVYGGGGSERVLGRAITGAQRDAVIVATKGGYRFRERSVVERWGRRYAKRVLGSRTDGTSGDERDSDQPASGLYDHQDFTSSYLRAAIHASLRRLRTDRIDVYQLHGPQALLPDLIGQLSDLVAVGDVVRFGVGSESVAVAGDWIDEPGVGVVQVPFGVLDPEAIELLFPQRAVAEGDVHVWARGVLGGGVLGLSARDPDALATHPKREQIRALRRLADDAGLDQYEFALRFVGSYGAVVSMALVGTTSLIHLRRDAELLAAPPLDDDLLTAIAMTALARSGVERSGPIRDEI